MQSEHNSDRWIRRAFEAKSKELRAKIFPDSISKHVAFLLFTRQHGKNLLGHCKEVSVFLAPLRHSSPSGLTRRTLFPTLVERGLCPDFFFLFCVRKSPVLFYSKHNIWKRFVRIIVVWSKKRTLYQTELITSMAFYFTRNPSPSHIMWTRPWEYPNETTRWLHTQRAFLTRLPWASRWITPSCYSRTTRRLGGWQAGRGMSQHAHSAAYSPSIFANKGR